MRGSTGNKSSGLLQGSYGTQLTCVKKQKLLVKPENHSSSVNDAEGNILEIKIQNKIGNVPEKSLAVSSRTRPLKRTARRGKSA